MLAPAKLPAVETQIHSVAGHALAIHRHRPRVDSGRPLQVFFVHGMADTADAWRTVADSLPDVEVWTFDLPWSGRAGNDWPHRLSATDWWRSALAHCGVQPDVCVGHSFGASVLMDWLLETPAAAPQLRGLMLVSPFYRGRHRPLGWADLDRFAAGVAERLAAALRDRAAPDAMPTASVLAAMADMLARRIVPDGLLEFFRLFLKSRCWHLGAWRTPTSLVFGTGDEDTVLDSVGELARALPQAQCMPIADCGHHPMYQQPLTMQRHLAGFLAGLAAWPERDDLHAVAAGAPVCAGLPLLHPLRT